MVRKKHLLTSVLVAIFVGLPGLAKACPVCYGKIEGPTNAAIQAAVFLLIGVTGLVLGGIVSFFIRMHRIRRVPEGISSYLVTDEGNIILDSGKKSDPKVND